MIINVLKLYKKKKKKNYYIYMYILIITVLNYIKKDKYRNIQYLIILLL